jgi:filamentous hemagglutinin
LSHSTLKLQGPRVVPVGKITGYLLNAAHPQGAGKAKFFAAHGFKPEEPDVLISAIKDHADVNSVIEVQETQYGTKSTVRCSVATPDGRNPCVLVVWIREPGREAQTLVTSYPSTPSIEQSN